MGILRKVLLVNGGLKAYLGEIDAPVIKSVIIAMPSNLGTESSLLNKAGLEVMDALALGLRDADAALG